MFRITVLASNGDGDFDFQSEGILKEDLGEWPSRNGCFTEVDAQFRKAGLQTFCIVTLERDVIEPGIGG
jgi:hypothetical protein